MLTRNTPLPFTHGILELSLELQPPVGRDEEDFELLVDDVFERFINNALAVPSALNRIPRLFQTNDEPQTSMSEFTLNVFGATVSFRVTISTTYSLGEDGEKFVNALVLPSVVREATEHAIKALAKKSCDGLEDPVPNEDALDEFGPLAGLIIGGMFSNS